MHRAGIEVEAKEWGPPGSKLSVGGRRAASQDGEHREGKKEANIRQEDSELPRPYASRPDLRNCALDKRIIEEGLVPDP